MSTSVPTQRESLVAPDITCGHCVASVQGALSELDGVQSVQASEETKQIDVDFVPSQVSLDKIKAVLDEEGYPVRG